MTCCNTHSKLATFCIQLSFFIDNGNHFQVVSLSNIKVNTVMCWGHLNRTWKQTCNFYSLLSQSMWPRCHCTPTYHVNLYVSAMCSGTLCTHNDTVSVAIHNLRLVRRTTARGKPLQGYSNIWPLSIYQNITMPSNSHALLHYQHRTPEDNTICTPYPCRYYDGLWLLKLCAYTRCCTPSTIWSYVHTPDAVPPAPSEAMCILQLLYPQHHLKLCAYSSCCTPSTIWSYVHTPAAEPPVPSEAMCILQLLYPQYHQTGGWVCPSDRLMLCISERWTASPAQTVTHYVLAVPPSHLPPHHMLNYTQGTDSLTLSYPRNWVATARSWPLISIQCWG